MFGQRGHEVLAVVVEGGGFLGVFVCRIDDGGVKLAAGCSVGSALFMEMVTGGTYEAEVHA